MPKYMRIFYTEIIKWIYSYPSISIPLRLWRRRIRLIHMIEAGLFAQDNSPRTIRPRTIRPRTIRPKNTWYRHLISLPRSLRSEIFFSFYEQRNMQPSSYFWFLSNQTESYYIHHFLIDLEHQTKFRFVPNQSENNKYNLILDDLTRSRSRFLLQIL